MACAHDIVGDHLGEGSRGDSAHFHQGLRNSGERWSGAACEEGVVKAHDTQVLRYPDGAPTRLLHDSECDLVAGGEDRRGSVGSIEQVVCDLSAGVIGEGAVGDQRFVELNTGLTRCRAVARQPGMAAVSRVRLAGMANAPVPTGRWRGGWPFR